MQTLLKNLTATRERVVLPGETQERMLYAARGGDARFVEKNGQLLKLVQPNPPKKSSNAEVASVCAAMLKKIAEYKPQRYAGLDKKGKIIDLYDIVDIRYTSKYPRDIQFSVKQIYPRSSSHTMMISHSPQSLERCTAGMFMGPGTDGHRTVFFQEP